MDIERLLQLAIDHAASDLHLSGGNPPLLRVDGEMRALDIAPLSGAEIGHLLQSVLDQAQRDTLAA
jgi:twitching motility protein PilT